MKFYYRATAPFYNAFYHLRDTYYPTYWRRTAKRFLKGKTVCHNCWRYPFACTHIDPDVLKRLDEKVNEMIKNGTIKIIEAPERPE